MKTKIRQTSFSLRGNILGLIEAAQLQRRSTDAMMIPVDVLTTHFGIHGCCTATASEFRRCNQISPTLLWRQKVIMSLTTFMKLSWWCPLGQGKWHLPAKEYIIMDRLIPILTHLSSHWTVPLMWWVQRLYRQDPISRVPFSSARGDSCMRLLNFKCGFYAR